MSLIARWLDKLEARTAREVDLHLVRAGIPEPRRSLTPSQVIDQHLFANVERIGTWSCCECCPPGCTEAHRDPCDRHQAGDIA